MAPIAEDDLEALISLLRSDLTSGKGDLYRRALEHFDRVIVCHAMNQSGGNLTKAAERLGLSRVTLRSKLRAMRRDEQKTVASPPEERRC
jgi:DNA-binding NtrC family response regulator